VRHAEKENTLTRVVLCCAGAVLLLAGFFVGSLVAVDRAEQRVLHERGVTATGAVTQAWDRQGLSPDSGVRVRLDDGTTVTVHGTTAEVGARVYVTRDPRHRVPSRLGPRPAVPDLFWVHLFLGLLAGGHVLVSAAFAGRLSRAVGPRVLRRAPGAAR
jgi:hypothetical protein